MAIRLPEEVRQLRDTVRAFVDEVVEPRAADIDRTNEIPDEILDKARELGLFGFSIPEAYGGLGESELASSVALETMSHGPGGVTFFIAPSAPAAAINLVGRQDQKDRYLADLASGSRYAAFCLSEAGAGSDAAGIKTKAVRKNGRWAISGTKLWISRASKASVFLVSAVTDPSKGAKGGISIFLIDKRKGINVGKPDWQLGGRGSGSAEVHFDECEAGDDELLGEVGYGFDALKFILGRARLWAAARAVGVVSRAAELSIAHADTRQQFGKKIGEFQAIKHKIADMAADLYTGRLLLYQAAALFDEGRDAAQEAAYAKLFCSEAAGRAADAAVQIHGAMGVSQDFGVERLFRDARAYRILDGTSDIQRGMIASRVQRVGLGDTLAPGGLGVNLGPVEELTADVVVVGAGGAGLRAAYEAAAAGADTIIVTKGRIAVSGATAVGLASSAGFAVPDGAGDPADNPDVHFNDIMTAAQGCADPKLVRILVDEAIDAAADLDRWNIDFIRDQATGKPLVAQGDFASRPRNRKIYHHGRPITVALKAEIQRLGVRAFEGTTVLSLLQDETGVHGLLALTRDGRLLRIAAGATVLTTGGAGQLFKLSLMPPDITGDGYALGYRAGAALANMEFMQAGFGTVKPALNIVYTWFWGGIPPFLDREGRSVLDGTLPAGASGEEAMRKKVEHYPFSASDASKWLEISAKNAMRDGRADAFGAFALDLRHTDPERLSQKGFAQLWNVSKGWLRQKNIDLDAEPLRIGLFGHAINGGLVIDEHGQTSVEGLFSAGENAAGPYGADRLGGNMLLNCQVFGKRAGRRAAEVGRERGPNGAARLGREAVAEAEARARPSGSLKLRDAHRRIKETMTEHALVVRNATGLEAAEFGVAQLAASLQAGDYAVETAKDFVALHEAASLIDVGRAMCAAALLRRETRGSHYREDAQAREEAWARPVMVRRGRDGAPHAEPGRFGAGP